MPRSGCFAILLLRTSLAVRTDVRTEDLSSEATGEECPSVCASMNYAFMKTNGLSDKMVREEVNKKCRFPMCMGCKGGADGRKAQTPCCTEGCELKEDAPNVDEMAEAIGKTATSEIAPIVEEYKAAQGEVCSYDHGNPWCLPPSINPGNKFRKGSTPLCCQQVKEANEEGKDVDKEVEEWLENTVKPPQQQAPVVDPACSIGVQYALKPITLKDVQKSVCINQQTKLPADRKCCAKEAAAVTSFEEAIVAEKECGEVTFDDCKSVQLFEELRNTVYKRKIPAAFTCKRMWWCTDNRDSPDRIGPVEESSLCFNGPNGKLSNFAFATCAPLPQPCLAGSTYSMKNVTEKDSEKSVCINEQTNLPVDEYCCIKEAEKAKPNATEEGECAKVDTIDCKEEGRFESVRQRFYKGLVPEGFTCKYMHWCANDFYRGEKIGPFEDPRVCWNMKRWALGNCAKVPLRVSEAE
mmetsp:Transcript_70576/g.132064  ORF Transcript_70576/g.132064 Transcript_70576/m.132064 type:complete len:466 (-) Transcript_70576:19-1416(-)